jgi:NAD(P)-dependent dehydrogenase (short-subunit alcohol dehydrogenase family)
MAKQGETPMIDPGLRDKVALDTGGNNLHGIGAAIARALAACGARVFMHYFRQVTDSPDEDQDTGQMQTPGLAYFSQQQSTGVKPQLLLVQVILE